MPSSQHMRRIRERVLEHVREHGRERAYIEGVEETSNKDDILFLDPDELTSDDPEKLLKQLLKQVKGQFPEELTSELELDVKEVMMDGESAEAFTLFANDIKDMGPAALTEAGIAIMPSSDYETKESFLRSALEDIYDEDTVDNIIENLSGNDKDWNRFLGNHEGTHLAENNDYDTPLEELTEEERADVGAEMAASKRGQDDMSFSFRDLRHLRADVDISHATGITLISGDPVSQLHVDAAASYKETMNKVVDATFDWEQYEGKATTPAQLFEENPEAYFDALDNVIDEEISRINNALAEYDQPLTFEETKEIVTAQIEVDYIKNFEGAYQRRILGQDVPEHEPTQFISQEAENAFYSEFAEKNKEPDPTPAETAHEQHIEILEEKSNIPKQAFENFNWESYEGKATTTGELLFEDVDLYYQVQTDYLKEMQDKAQAQYDADPSYENTQQLIETQEIINNRYESMDEYRKDILGENIARREPLELISEEDQDAYYEERARLTAEKEAENTLKAEQPETETPEVQNTDNDSTTEDVTPNKAPIVAEPEKGYEAGINKSAYTTEVSGLTSGTPSVDFETGVTVNDAPITNIFAETANPAPNDIILVDARVTPPEEQFALPPQDVQNNANVSLAL
ncbi:MAG: hypothetical protein COB36_02340 [Alphaproteobacteria bacterium]|nr:MAG: hypothetical protein COB36_02340 [Alphaproteobacteria bacterium]